MKASSEKTVTRFLRHANEQQEAISGFHARNGERVSSMIKGSDPLDIVKMVATIIGRGAGHG